MSQTSEAPPAKRQRTEEELTRSDIWHDDGSVVLQVESTLFRVHWGVICLHSTFFRDMRDIPQPPDQPKLAGCPVIELHDSAEDVKHLLHALYNTLIFNKEKLSFPFIAAMVRMGRKYDFKNLLDAAVQRLQEEHAVTVEEHETFFHRAITECSYTPHTIVRQPGLVFDMLTLARENNLFTLLPSAYFRAIFLRSKVEILDGIPSKDGDPPAMLSSLDQRICILGIQKILKAAWDHDGFHRWMTSAAPSPGCTNNQCRMRKPLISYILVRNTFEALGPFLAITGESWPWICGQCVRYHMDVMAGMRKKMWEDLPSYFDLPPWDELKNDI
ncbi:hypothetical protein C8R45DRAFT_876618 [Mycena sanguinolenta]|nr:hypothetical protein C8R45DRAFT_876618 [Mycena sanguinolenta]